MGVKKNPFETPELKAFLKGHELGTDQAEERDALRVEPIWPAIDRAIELAMDLEEAARGEHYFTWQLLMNELETIAKKKPRAGRKK